jgi:hypothetical protein
VPKGRVKVYQKSYPDYFNNEDSEYLILQRSTGMTHEHIRQFLAPVNDVGITDVHRIRLFPLSLSGTAFNWFTSLAPNSVDSWVALEQRFHDYFYNGEIELRLCDLTAVR